jgi:hypothetical protein
MYQNVATYNLFVSSQYRSSGTTSNFNFSLPRSINLQNPSNWFSVRIGSAEIPYVFKLINATNNQIQYQLIRNAISYTATIALEPGNYNILTLLTELKNKLVESIQQQSSWDASSVLTFSYNRSTGKVLLSLVGTDSIPTTLTLLSASPVFLRCIGFSALPPTFGYTSPSLRTNTTSTQNVNVSQNTGVYIRSENLTQTVNFEAVVSQPETSDILAKVQLTSLPQSLVLWTNPTDLEVDVSNKILDSINLYLGDAQSYELDLGNLDWSCRITINEWSEKQDSHLQDYPHSIIPEPSPELLREREKLVRKLQKLKGKLLTDAPQSENTQNQEAQG